MDTHNPLKEKAVKDYCHRCQTETETVFTRLNAGHIENACKLCSARRLGAPYISKKKFNKLQNLGLISSRGAPKRGDYYGSQKR